MTGALPVLPTAALPTAASLGSPTLKNLGDPYIRFRLNEHLIGAVDTRQAQEVLVIAPQQLTVVPTIASTIMGLINHRSRIFWVIDLPHLLGLAPLDPRAAEYHLAILHVGQVHLGIAVQQIQGITRIVTEDIASPFESDIPAGFVPYLQGCLDSGSEQLLVLDAASIAAYNPHHSSP